MTTLVLGDPHIGGGLSLGKIIPQSNLNSRIIDQFKLLDWALNFAIENEVKDIIITGDIFDTAKPLPNIVSMFINWIKSCSDEGINVRLLLGNHDLFRHGSTLISPLDIIGAADLDNTYVYKSMTTVHMNGISFTMLPFQDRRHLNVDSHNDALKIITNKIPYELADIDRNNMRVAIAHLALEGSIPALDEIEDTSNEIFLPINTFNQYDVALCGHIHKPQVLNNSPHVAHIGSLDINNFGEEDQQKLAALIDPHGSEPIKYIEIPTRRLNSISISVPANVIDTVSYVIDKLDDQKPYLQKSITKLNIVLENPEVATIDRGKVERFLEDAGVYYTTRITEERKVGMIKKSSIPEEFNDTVSEITAIKMYADINVDEMHRGEFVSLANEIVKEYQ